jgi:hypothetical protein
MFRNDEEAATLVRQFETGELKPSDFKHTEHLTVGLWYVRRLGPEAALDAMRRSIINFLAHHMEDANVYHETITDFWIRRVAAFASSKDESAGRAIPFFELANALAAECGNSRLVFDYFSRELIASGEARARRVAPDLKPLDF